MNSTWQAFLAQQGAQLDDQGRASFAANPGIPDCALADLSDLGLIRVSGGDAQTFLQGQITADARQVSDVQSQLGSHLSHKGRMQANFRLFKRGDAIYLQLPRDRITDLLKRLRMFVLRADAKLEDASDELVQIGLIGDCWEAVLGELPADEAGASLTQDDLTLIRHPGEPGRLVVIGPLAAVQALWQQAPAQAQPAGPDLWPLLDIRAGLPWVQEATNEAFVPQMTNLQLLGGVSFTKGCYTGQEVVARMQYLGKLKRRMYRVRFEGDPASAGTEIFSPASSSGQGAGRLVDARPTPEGGCEGLAVLEIAAAEAGGLRLVDAAGPELELLGLPYSFDAE